jgi:hypothetical protein
MIPQSTRNTSTERVSFFNSTYQEVGNPAPNEKPGTKNEKTFADEQTDHDEDNQ